MKRCSRCKQELPLGMFGKNKAQKDGLNNECKTCAKKSCKISRANIKCPDNTSKRLKELKVACRKFADNRDLLIEDIIDLAALINNYIDVNELELM